MSKCTEHSPGPQGRKDKMMSRKLIAGERQYCSRNNPGLELCVSKNLSPVYWMQGSEQMLTTWVLTLNCSPNISVEQGEVCFLAVEFFFFFLNDLLFYNPPLNSEKVACFCFLYFTIRDEVLSPLLYLNHFHVGDLSCEQTLIQSAGSSLSSACFTSAIDYSVLFFLSFLLDLSFIWVLVGQEQWRSMW